MDLEDRPDQSQHQRAGPGQQGEPVSAHPGQRAAAQQKQPNQQEIHCPAQPRHLRTDNHREQAKQTQKRRKREVQPFPAAVPGGLVVLYE